MLIHLPFLFTAPLGAVYVFSAGNRYFSLHYDVQIYQSMDKKSLNDQVFNFLSLTAGEARKSEATKREFTTLFRFPWLYRKKTNDYVDL